MFIDRRIKSAEQQTELHLLRTQERQTLHFLKDELDLSSHAMDMIGDTEQNFLKDGLLEITSVGAFKSDFYDAIINSESLKIIGSPQLLKDIGECYRVIKTLSWLNRLYFEQNFQVPQKSAEDNKKRLEGSIKAFVGLSEGLLPSVIEKIDMRLIELR